MLELLVLVQVKALHLLRSCQSHAHLPILLILIRILLLHLPYLSMFAPLHLPLIHKLVIVIFLIAAVILPLILSASLFAPFIRLLIILLVLLASFVSSLLITPRSILLPVIIVFSGLFTDLYNGYLAIVIIIGKLRCSNGRLRPQLTTVFIRHSRLGSFHDQLVLKLLDVLSAVSLADMVRKRLLAHAEHQREAQLETLRL